MRNYRAVIRFRNRRNLLAMRYTARESDIGTDILRSAGF